MLLLVLFCVALWDRCAIDSFDGILIVLMVLFCSV